MAHEGGSVGKNFLSHPLVVGVAVFLVTFFGNKYLGPGKQLSFTIEPPAVVFDKSSVGTATVKINDIPVTEVFTVKVKIWNSGDVAIKNLPVTIDWAPTPVTIFGVSHNTVPPREFGAIQDVPAKDQASPSERRYVYALLNQNDSDTIVFLVGQQNPPRLYAKNEDLKLVEVKADAKDRGQWSPALSGFIAGVVGILATWIFDALRRKRREWAEVQAQAPQPQTIFVEVPEREREKSNPANNDVPEGAVPLTAAALRAGFFNHKVLNKVAMSGQNLAKIAVIGVTMEGADLSRTDLTSTVFTACEMPRANLQGATMVLARFSHCKLQAADFRGAKLSKVTFAATRLEGADMRCDGLETCTLEVTYDASTKWPEGFNPDAKGAVKV